jgi:hypothetical protein
VVAVEAAVGEEVWGEVLVLEQEGR